MADRQTAPTSPPLVHAKRAMVDHTEPERPGPDPDPDPEVDPEFVSESEE
jgi:hypothetical protein